MRDDLLNGEPCCNISAKDRTYSEMTAPYWAWKNIKALYPRLEYIGVNHYRRYFSFEGAVPFYHCIKKPEAAAAQYKLNLGKLESILSKHDIVMAKPTRFPYSVAIQYAACHPCLQVLRKVVHSKYPEYDREMYNALDRRNRMSVCNLCIMRWDDFDAYCTWAFDILFEIEKQTIDDGNYDSWRGRFLGGVAERLFNVWVLHRGLKVKHLPFVLYNGGQNSRALYNALALAGKNLSFFLQRLGASLR